MVSVDPNADAFLASLFPQEKAKNASGNCQLMLGKLIRILSGHAANNLRVLNQMAAERLSTAAQQDLPRLDESLFDSKTI
jgi:hypothetical protein